MKFSEFKVDAKKEVEELKEKNKEQVENIEEKIREYENLSREDLLKEFLNVSKQQRESGELNDEKIKNIKSVLQPLLSDEQQQNLDYLLGMVKDDKQD